MKRSSSLLLALVALILHALAAKAQLVAGQTYRILPVNAKGKSLFVKNASKADKAEVLMWTETDVPAQQWRVGAMGSTFTFRNVYTNAYLGLTSTARGAKTCQVASLSSGRWKLEAVDEAEGIYYIKYATGSNRLALAATDDGSQPTLAAPDDVDTQQWRFVAVDEKKTFTPTLRQEMMDDFIKVFVKRHGDYRSFGSGSWGNAEMLEVGLDAYESTGLKKYLDLCISDYNWFSQNVGASWNHLVYKDEYKWYGHDFNDDVMWQIIAVARMAWLTGESQYLNAARRNFDLIYQRAFMPEWGMMRWAEESGSPTGTNSCIMGPTEVAACYLGMAGAGEEYFEKARDLYAKQREKLANMSTGQVYDSFTIDPATGGVARDDEGKERFNRWASTYNQGTMLGAATLLYLHYGDEQYRSDADKIATYAIRNLCNSDGFIHVCQVNDGDLCGFKGILMRYMRRYVLDLCKPKRASWLTDNAFLAYNNRNARGVTTSAWLTKSTNDNATNAFSCSTAASAAVNCVFTDVEKDAYTTLPSSQIDYHGGTFAVKADGRDVISIKDGTWAVFDNMEFGTEAAQSIAVEFGKFTTSGTATIEVHLDKPDSQPVATLTATNANSEGFVFAATQPITGRHHVYLRFAYSTKSRANAYQVASIQFSRDTAYDFAHGIKDIAPSPRRSSQPLSYDIVGRQMSPSQPGLHIAHGRKVLLTSNRAGSTR